MRIRRRTAIPLIAAAASELISVSAPGGSAGHAMVPLQSSGLEWHDVRDIGVEGRGFEQTKSYYDRLPGKAEGVVRDAVWNLSRHSAGMMVRFQTDSSKIHAEYELTSSRLAMPHMPATGVSGLDLYARDGRGKWRWVAVCKPESTKVSSVLVQGLPEGTREFAIYLPLYNGTSSLRIGVEKGTLFHPIAPRRSPPLVFYGTSITQGACASRPGMPHPAILGRRLDRPVINLGFSGNGKMEESVGRFLVQLDAGVYVIDCLPNMTESEISDRTIPLVNQIRAARPDVPIILVEDRTYSASWLLTGQQRRHKASRQALRRAWMRLRDNGIEHLHYLEGEKLLSDDREGTTDGSHPSDLGFVQQADAFEPVIRKALAEAPGA